jgi:hypothetical protein
MNKTAKAKAIKAAGGVLVGGLAMGVLMALTVPTHMKRETETWRDVLGIREVAAAEPTISFEAPPQDLTPVHWAPASAEYPSAVPQDHWTDVSADAMPDISGAPELAPEPLPAEILESRNSDNRVTEDDVDDAAGNSADAAQAAASDVLAVENTAVEPAAATAAAPSAPPPADQATT